MFKICQSIFSTICADIKYWVNWFLNVRSKLQNAHHEDEVSGPNQGLNSHHLTTLLNQTLTHLAVLYTGFVAQCVSVWFTKFKRYEYVHSFNVGHSEIVPAVHYHLQVAQMYHSNHITHISCMVQNIPQYEKKIFFVFILINLFNPFLVNISILYLRKTPQNP